MCTVYKADKSQRVGIRFFSSDDMQERGVPGDSKVGIVAMLADDSPAKDDLARGDRVVSIGGVSILSPIHCADTLRECEGFIKIGVLPPLPDFDISLETYEDAYKPLASPRQSIGAGKPILGAGGDENIRRAVRMNKGGSTPEARFVVSEATSGTRGASPASPWASLGGGHGTPLAGMAPLDLATAKQYNASHPESQSPRSLSGSLSARSRAAASAVLNSPRMAATAVVNTVKAPLETYRTIQELRKMGF